jgi:hypothetical protein
VYAVKGPALVASKGWLLAMLVNVNLVCLLYIIAFFRGEPNPYYSDRSLDDGDRAASTPLVAAAQAAPPTKRVNPFAATPSDGATPPAKPTNPFAAAPSDSGSGAFAADDGAGPLSAAGAGSGGEKRSWLFY